MGRKLESGIFKGLERSEKKIWLSSPTMHGDEKRWIERAIDTNWVSTVGENIDEIEKWIAGFIGVKYAVGLSCGTSALHLATRLAAEKLYGQARPDEGTLRGRKVFCTDMTFDASINPVAYEDGNAVFIDTERKTWNMSPEALEVAFCLYPEVRLVIVAHLYGTPARMDEIRSVCNKHGALIVEDAAESLGAKYLTSLCGGGKDSCQGAALRGSDNSGVAAQRAGTQGAAALTGDCVWRETGALGDYSAISFNGNKIITGSAGGMFLTDSKEDADKVRKWSTQSREAAPWYQHEEIGFNYRMSNIIAGVIRGQLPFLDEHIAQKKAIYDRYKAGLSDLPVKMNPFDEDKAEPNFWLSCMTVDPDAMSRSVRSESEYIYESEPGKSSPHEILDALTYFNAEGRPIWKPMHMQPVYRMNPFVTTEGSGRGRTNAYIAGSGEDVGADIFSRGLCLPSDNKMTPEEQDFVIEIIHRCFA